MTKDEKMFQALLRQRELRKEISLQMKSLTKNKKEIEELESLFGRLK